MVAAILAAALSFTATATGVEKGTAVEFFFAGKGTDRDYESMFLLQESVDSFCSRLENAGLPRGRPTDLSECRLWPVGCKLRIEPDLSTYVEGTLPDGRPLSDMVYTGGIRLGNGSCDAGTNLPMSVFSSFTLAQSPVLYNGIYNQGEMYGLFLAKSTLEKGKTFVFTLSWNPEDMPVPVHVTARPGKTQELIAELRDSSKKGELDVLLGFDGDMTVYEAIAVSHAVATLDSSRVKFNGRTNVFYRSFLPLVKWRDRKERLTQPFELTIGATTDKLVYIDEDWSVEGDDPKLTPLPISFSDSAKYEKTDSCFVYASKTTTVSRVLSAIDKLMKGKKIANWYVFAEE